MNFLFYVFKKDLRKLKWVLIVWTGLLCAQSFMGIGRIKIIADNFALQMILPQIGMLIGFLQRMMIIIIIPLLIQDDSLVGTTGFWLTRPIGKKQLFLTKGCFVVSVLLFLSLMAEIIVFIANGIAFNYILPAIPEIIIEKLAFMMPFIILAAITPKLSRYAIVGISIFAALVLASILASVLSILLPHDYRGVFTKLFFNNKAAHNYTLGLSIGVVQKIFIILFGTGLIYYQYISRKTMKTIALVILGFILLMALNRIWEIDFIGTVSPRNQENITADTVKVAIDANHVIVEDSFRYRKTDTHGKSISARMSISCSAQEQFGILTNLTSRIEYQDKKTLQSQYFSPVMRETLEDAKYSKPLQALLPDSKILNSVIDHRGYKEIFECTERDFNFYKNMPGTYKADADLDIYKYEIRSEIALKQGSRGNFGSEQIVIYDVLCHESGISVIVGEKKTNLLFDRSQEKIDITTNMLYSFPRSVYIIENKKRGEAFLQAASIGPMSDFDEMINSKSRLYTRAKRLDFIGIGNSGKIDQQWLKDAQLVRLDTSKAASVKKKLEFEEFILPEKSTDPAPKRDPLEQALKEQDYQIKVLKE